MLPLFLLLDCTGQSLTCPLLGRALSSGPQQNGVETEAAVAAEERQLLGGRAGGGRGMVSMDQYGHLQRLAPPLCAGAESGLQLLRSRS